MNDYARSYGHNDPGENWILMVYEDNSTKFYPFDEHTPMWCCASKYQINDLNAEEVDQAFAMYDQALAVFPGYSYTQRALVHGKYADLLDRLGRVEEGLEHWKMAAMLHNEGGGIQAESECQYKAALALVSLNRYEEALEYAQKSLARLLKSAKTKDKAIQELGQLIDQLQQNSVTTS